MQLDAITWTKKLDAEIGRALHRFDFVAAHQAADRALAQATEPAQRAWALYWQARGHYIGGQLEAALPRAMEAAALGADHGDSALESRARALQARCLLGAGQTQAALEQSLAALRTVDAAMHGRADVGMLLPSRLAALIALGTVHLSLRQLDEALAYSEHAVACARTVNDQLTLGGALDTVACVLSEMAAQDREQGRAEEAERHERAAIRYSAEAVRIAREQGHVDHEASALNNLVESMVTVGEAPQALEMLDDWARHHPKAPDRVQAHHFDTRGLVCLGLGLHAEAVAWFERALQHAAAPAVQQLLTRHLAQALERCGRWQDALAAHKAFHALHVQVSAETAQRGARIAAVMLDAERDHVRTEKIAQNNRRLRRREDLQRLAQQDPLTGLIQRQHLRDHLADGFAGDALALIDVDQFQPINEQHSRVVGDLVLKRLAEMMRLNHRSHDLPARLDGSALVLLLRRLAPEEARAAAERLRAAVAAYPWTSVAPGLKVTVSIGIAHGADSTDADTLHALAERRLGAAQRAGHNRVVAQD